MKKRSLSYLFLFVTAFALTSCGTPNGAAVSPDGSSTAVSSSESSKAVVSGESSQTGCIKWNLLENHETLDPLVFDEPLITGLLFFGLTGIDVETLEVVPKLAESWEMNDDGTKWTFTLRDDVFWIGTNQEGNPEKLRPVNADDILLTFERGMVQDYGAGPQWMGFEIVKNWGKDDDFTIWFELNEPMDDFPRYASFINGTTISGDDFEFVEDMPIGNGPFMMGGPWDHDDEIVLERNPYLPDHIEGIPDETDEIIFTREDQDTALQKLENGELNVVEIAYPIEFEEEKAELISADGRFFLVNSDKKDEVIAAAGFAGILFNVRPAQSWRASYSGDKPASCDEAAFTYENPGAIEAYIQGDYDPDSKETINNPSFDDIVNAVESGKIVLLQDEYCYGEGWTKFIGPDVIKSLNRVPNHDGSHNICLVDAETGQDQFVKVWNMEKWYTPDLSSTINSIEIYETDEGTCYHGTVYIGINLDRPPFNQLEARQALAGITDKVAYLQNMFGSNDDVTNSLIPHHFLGKYADQYKDVAYRFIPETTSLINAFEQLSLAYCGDCEGNYRMAEGFISLWENELGVVMKSTSISYDEYDGPIKGGSQALYFKFYSATSWLDFVMDGVKEGYFMIPDEEYEEYMRLVEETALEADKIKQAQMIMELDRLLLEKIVSVIPVWSDYYCELDIPEPVEVDIEPIIEEVETLIISAEKDYANHNCDNLYPKSYVLAEKCNRGLEMATSDVDKAFFYYCLALTEYWEYQLEDSKLFFGEALRLGLEGEKKDNAEKALTEIEVKNSQGSCKVGEIYFADKWINETPLTSTGLDNITNEICVNVEFDSRECLADELTFVWKRDDNVICRHPYESEYFENSEVLGSMYYQDDHGILPEGKYTVQIYYGSTLLGEASHDHIKNE